MRDRSASVGLVAVALAALTWSVGAVGAGAAFQRGISPVDLGAARVWLTALGVGVVVLATRRPVTGDRDERVPAVHLLAFGGSIALVSVVFFFAIERLGVAIGTVLHYMAPLFVIAFGVLGSRRKPPTMVSVAAVVSLVGVVLVSNALARNLAAVDGVGILIGLASATMFASYTLLAERVIRVHGPVRALFLGFGIGAVLWLVVQLPRGWPGDLVAAGNLGLVLFVGLLGTCLPFLLYIWGIQRVRAERAAVAATLEPVITGVIAWVVLAQALMPWQIVGGVAILGAVLSLQLAPPTAPLYSSSPDGVGRRNTIRKIR